MRDRHCQWQMQHDITNPQTDLPRQRQQQQYAQAALPFSTQTPRQQQQNQREQYRAKTVAHMNSGARFTVELPA